MQRECMITNVANNCKTFEKGRQKSNELHDKGKNVNTN